MTEKKRLFIGGLHPETAEPDLKARFVKFGNVGSVDIRTRHDEKGEPLKTFAYVDIDIGENELKQCMQVYSKTKWRGHEMQIQLAKPSFLDKLKEEREKEAAEKKESPKPAISSKVIYKEAPVKDFHVKGAVPGTAIDEHENWVVGKYGRVMPIMNLKKNTKMLKVDPSKYCHFVKKLERDDKKDKKKPSAAPAETEVSVTDLTWQLEERKYSNPDRNFQKRVKKTKKKSIVNASYASVNNSTGGQKRKKGLSESGDDEGDGSTVSGSLSRSVQKVRTENHDDTFEVVTPSALRPSSVSVGLLPTPTLTKSSIKRRADAYQDGLNSDSDSADTDEIISRSLKRSKSSKNTPNSKFNKGVNDKLKKKKPGQSAEKVVNINGDDDKATMSDSSEDTDDLLSKNRSFSGAKAPHVSKSGKDFTETNSAARTQQNSSVVIDDEFAYGDFGETGLKKTPRRKNENYYFITGSSSDEDLFDKIKSNKINQYVRTEIYKAESQTRGANFSSYNNLRTTSTAKTHSTKSAVQGRPTSSSRGPQKKTFDSSSSDTDDDDQNVPDKNSKVLKQTTVNSNVPGNATTASEKSATSSKIEPKKSSSSESGSESNKAASSAKSESEESSSSESDSDSDVDGSKPIATASETAAVQPKESSSSGSDSDSDADMKSAGVQKNTSPGIKTALNPATPGTTEGSSESTSSSDTTDNISESKNIKHSNDTSSDSDSESEEIDLKRSKSLSNKSQSAKLDIAQQSTDDKADESSSNSSESESEDSEASEKVPKKTSKLHQVKKPGKTNSKEATKDSSSKTSVVNTQKAQKSVVENHKAESDESSSSDDSSDEDDVDVPSTSQVRKDVQKAAVVQNTLSEKSKKQKVKPDTSSSSSDSSDDSDSENNVQAKKTESIKTKNKAEESVKPINESNSANLSETSKKQEVKPDTSSSSSDSSDDSDSENNVQAKKKESIKAKNKAEENVKATNESSSGNAQEKNSSPGKKVTSASPAVKDKADSTKKKKAQKDATKNPSKDALHQVTNEKRLASLKERHNAEHKAAQSQKSVLQKALSLDGKSMNKKVVFDSDSGEEDVKPAPKEDEQPAPQQSAEPEGKPLFSSGDDDSDTDADAGGDGEDQAMFRHRPEYEGKKGRKLMGLQAKIGRDDRFKMDAKFMESDSEESEAGEEEVKVADRDEASLQAEKHQSMEILKGIVGNKAVLSAMRKKRPVFKDMSALQYDPTREDHKHFEIEQPQKDTAEKPAKSKKKKKKTEAEEVVEVVPEVSGERFFEVSSDLKFKGTESEEKPFSLLAMFGGQPEVKAVDTEVKDMDTEVTIEIKQKPIVVPETSPWQQTEEFDSDMEEDGPLSAKREKKQVEENAESEAPRRDIFFFSVDDPRIMELTSTFCRTQDLDTLRQKWLKKRPENVEAYKLRRKRALVKAKAMKSVKTYKK